MTDVNKLLEERRNQFITTRRDIEIYIETFFSELEKVPPKLLADVELPSGRTAQEIFPSLYVEPFDEEQYNKEYEAFNQCYEKVQGVAEYLNQKAEELLGVS